MISRFFGSTYLLILKILWNWCRNKHDPSISRIFQSNFLAGFCQLAQLCGGGSSSVCQDFRCSCWIEEGRKPASRRRHLLLLILWNARPRTTSCFSSPASTVDSTCCSFRPQSSLPHACKISGNVDQKCRFKVFFLGRPSSVTASLKKVPSKLLIGDWVLRSA